MSLGLFKSKLHLAVSNDDLRPAMTHVAFVNGYAYATDAHVAIRQSLAWMDFSPEEIAIMNGKFLTAEGYELAAKAASIEVTEDCLIIRTKKRQVISIDWADCEAKYPDVDHVINGAMSEGAINEFPQSITTVGYNPKKVTLLLSAMYFSETAVFEVRKPNNAVVVYDSTTGTEDQVAIIMPILLNP